MADNKHRMNAGIAARHGRDHITLVPRPTDDPNDPLNWSQSKKYITLAIVSWASFVSIVSAICFSSDFAIHGKTYGKTLTEMSYTVSVVSHSHATL